MLENLTPTTKVSTCKVRTLYETLPPKDAEFLRQYIDDVETWNSFALSRALRQKGIVIDNKVIARHRENFCSCEQVNAGKS